MSTPPKIPRREFFRLSSMGVLGMAAAGPGLIPQLISKTRNAQAASSQAPFSIGYWQGSHHLTDFADLAPAETPAPFFSRLLGLGPESFGGRTTVVGANSLSRPDETFFGQQAWVKIQAMHIASASSQAATDSFRASALYDTAKNETIPVLMAHFSHDVVLNDSACVEFSVPVFSKAGLRFRLEHHRPSMLPPTAPVTTDVSLGLDGQDNAPSLQRGVYFIAHTEQALDWHQYQFQVVDNADGRPERQLVRSSWSGCTPAPFDYIVFSVDHAPALQPA